MTQNAQRCWTEYHHCYNGIEGLKFITSWMPYKSSLCIQELVWHVQYFCHLDKILPATLSLNTQWLYFVSGTFSLTINICSRWLVAYCHGPL